VLYAASVEARELRRWSPTATREAGEGALEKRARRLPGARRGQRGLVLKAERDVRLLEKLREKRLGEWQAAADKEQEALASELFLAQWHRQ